MRPFNEIGCAREERLVGDDEDNESYGLYGIRWWLVGFEAWGKVCIGQLGELLTFLSSVMNAKHSLWVAGGLHRGSCI